MEMPCASSLTSLPLTSRYRRLSAFALTAIALTGFLWGLSGNASAAVGSSDPDAVLTKEIQTDPADAIARWTPEEFRDAQPLDDPTARVLPFELSDLDAGASAVRPGDYAVKDPTAIPKRFHGKVFFFIGSAGYSCSGTMISSRLSNAVFTAGHCLFDRVTRAYVSTPVFVPAYTQGTAPLGIYPAAFIKTTRGWQTGNSFSNDIGIMALIGSPVATLGGGRPVAFNQHVRKRSYTIFGYPADPNPPFNGENLFGCHSKVVGRDRGKPRPMAAYPCHMSHGASGGGWISGHYLSAVTSYVYCDTDPKYCGYLFGPYFARSARNLYKSVGGSITSGITFVKRPPRRLKRHTLKVVMAGIASTPLKYQCRLGQRKFRKCGRKTRLRHLSKGRHVLRVRAFDQTGRQSANTLKAKFRVLR